MSTEQSSPSRVAGKGFRTFTHNGKTYLLSQPLRMGSYVDEESLVLWKRRDPAEFGLRMIARLPASYHAAIWEGCASANMRGIPSEEEWAAYNASTWKTAFMLWTTLDSRHKAGADKEPIDLIDGVQWALNFLTKLPHIKDDHGNIVDGTYEDLLLKISFVSQEHAIKNSSGRHAAAEPATTEQLPETPDTTAGPPSSPTSPDQNTAV